MRVIQCEQRTPAWLSERAGKVTASGVAHALAVLKRKDGEAQVRKDYKARIVAEILTGFSAEQYVSPAMVWGSEQESFAVTAYEIQSGSELEHVGFVLHPTIDRFGASPDGLVGDKGMIEAKCPSTTTHLDYILNDVVPEEYQPQMLAGMVCCERDWCDFVSYDPRLPEHLQLFVKRFERDNERIGLMEAGVLQFLSEVDDILARLPQAPPQTAKEESLEQIKSELDAMWISEAEVQAHDSRA